MRGLLLVAVLTAAISTSVAAQEPRPLIEMSDSEPMACSTASIMFLAQGDFVAVRAGPSRRSRELARLSNGDNVYACGRRGNWFAIVFERPDRGSGCGVLQRWPRVAPYRGPCRSGWVHNDYIGAYADWISP